MRWLFSLVMVMLIASVATAGNWTVNITGIGSATSFFGAAEEFNRENGEPTHRYTENVPDKFVYFVVIKLESGNTVSGDVMGVFRITYPDGTTYSDSHIVKAERYERLWFWKTYDMSGLPSGTYIVQHYINGTKTAGTDIHRR